MRTGPSLPAGCLARLALEGLHLFDGERVWKIFFQIVKIIAGLQRRSRAFIVTADWLRGSWDNMIGSYKYSCAVFPLLRHQKL